MKFIQSIACHSESFDFVQNDNILKYIIREK